MLVAAVESVLGQDLQPVEIVVAVDHNDELLQRVRRRWPEITALPNEFVAGASGNRNTGIMHTNAPFVALLDDDARARTGWLSGLLAPFDDPSVVGSGGSIVPSWQRPRPTWFPDELLWAVVGTSDTATTPTIVRNVWSASMAVRRSAFDAACGFRVGFGKRGNRPRPEDTDLCLRMADRGRGHWVYVPDAVVDHVVPADRMTLRSVLGRCYHEGRGKVELARAFGGSNILDVERDYLQRTVPTEVLRNVWATLSGRGAAHGVRAAVLVAGMLAAITGAAVESLHPRQMYPEIGGSSAPAFVPVPPAPVRYDPATIDADLAANGRNRATVRRG